MLIEILPITIIKDFHDLFIVVVCYKTQERNRLESWIYLKNGRVGKLNNIIVKSGW
jgi:hypothetical protein